MNALKLKKHLLDAYGSFADKRIKKLTTGDTFIADDRGPGDFGADGQFYYWFCPIFVRVVDGSTVEVSLSGNVPMSADLRKWIKKDGSKLDEHDYMRSSLRLKVSIGDEDRLDDLAGEIEAITRKKYEIASYKYVCPRTARSLRRLVKILRDYT